MCVSKCMLIKLITLVECTFYQLKVHFVGLLQFLLTIFLKAQQILLALGSILNTKVHAKLSDNREETVSCSPDITHVLEH